MKLFFYCPDCDGTGIKIDSADECPKCGGWRLIEATAKDVPLEIQREIAGEWWTAYINGKLKDGNEIGAWQGVKE